MKIGLFFGTFNPVHVGHLIIANHMAEFTDLDSVWLVLTPKSPFKKKKTLLDNYQRLQLLYLATEDHPKLKPCDVEFKLKQPNYTALTLLHLEEKYPNYEFAPIMGEDNLKHLHKWKNYEAIIENYDLYVYPRKNQIEPKENTLDMSRVKRVQAPLIELSSSFIRDAIRAGKNVSPMIPNKSWKYLDEMNFYVKWVHWFFTLIT